MLSQAGTAGMTLSALAKASDEARSSVHRTLVALADHGFVIQSGNRGNYKLGPGAYALALRAPSINEVVATYRPALLEITTRTLLSSYLMVRSGLDTICLDYQVGQIVAQPFISGIGGRIPLGIGVSGSCILGMMEVKARQRCLELLADKYREWDVSREEIEAEIVFYHRHGYVAGLRRSQSMVNLTLAVPVLNNNWRGLEVALSVLAPASTLDETAQAAVIDQMRRVARRADDVANETNSTEA